MHLHTTLPNMTLPNAHHLMFMFGRQTTLQSMLSLNGNILKNCAIHFGNLKIPPPPLPPHPAAFTEHARMLEETKGNIIAAPIKQKEIHDKKHCKPGQFQCVQTTHKTAVEVLVTIPETTKGYRRDAFNCSC